MSYREPARRAVTAEDLDPDVVRRRPWHMLVVFFILYTPFTAWFLVFLETGDPTVGTGSASRPVSLAAKIVVAGVYAAVLVVLLVLRARDERRMRAVTRAIRREVEAADPNPLVRVAAEEVPAGEDVHEPDARRRGTAR